MRAGGGAAVSGELLIGLLVGVNLTLCGATLWSVRPLSRRRRDQQIELLMEMARRYGTGRMGTARGRFRPALRLSRLTTASGTVSTFMLTAQLLAAIVDTDDEVRWAFIREQIEAAMEQERRGGGES